MFITTPNNMGETDKPTVFRRHRMTKANGRAVRPGFDYLCLTGYHRLHHGRALKGTNNAYFCTDITVAPIDAPETIPAGSCEGHDSLVGDPVRHCSQTYIFRGE